MICLYRSISLSLYFVFFCLQILNDLQKEPMSTHSVSIIYNIIITVLFDLPVFGPNTILNVSYVYFNSISRCNLLNLWTPSYSQISTIWKINFIRIYHFNLRNNFLTIDFMSNFDLCNTTALSCTSLHSTCIFFFTYRTKIKHEQFLTIKTSFILMLVVCYSIRFSDYRDVAFLGEILPPPLRSHNLLYVYILLFVSSVFKIIVKIYKIWEV